MKTIYIVTGANGFLGNNLVRILPQTADTEVRAFILPGDGVQSLEGVRCTAYFGDVTKKAELKALFDVPKTATVFVVHCAGIVYIKAKPNPLVHAVNVGGTRNVAEMALQIGAKLVYVSSVHAVATMPRGDMTVETRDFDPARVHGLYAKTKAEASRLVLDMVRYRGLNACIVLPSGMLGPYDFGRSHLMELVREAAEGRLPALARGGYDFADVRDVAAGVFGACERGERGACYFLSNRYITIKELADTVCDVSGRPHVRPILPLWLAKLGAPICEAYYKTRNRPPLFTAYSLKTIASNSSFSNKKAREALGYTNRPLEETVSDTLEWLKSRSA